MGSKSSANTSTTSTNVSRTSTLDVGDVTKALVLSGVEASGDINVTDAGAVASAFEFASETQAGAGDLVEKAIQSGQMQVDKLAKGFSKVLEQKQSEGATVWAGTIKSLAWAAGLGGVVWAITQAWGKGR